MKKNILFLLTLSLTVWMFGCGEVKSDSNITTSSDTAVSSVSVEEINETQSTTVSIEEKVEEASETTAAESEESVIDSESEIKEQVVLSNNIEDYTIEDIDVFIGNVVEETEYYYGPSEAFDIYKDKSGGMDMGHLMPGYQAIVYGQCEETGWWRLDLGRSGEYPVVFVPERCIERP